MLVQNRIQAELIRLAGEAGSAHGQAVLSPAPSLADIASRISAHREAVSRELSRLVSLGLLRRDHGALTITDLQRLAKLVDGKDRPMSTDTALAFEPNAIEIEATNAIIVVRPSIAKRALNTVLTWSDCFGEAQKMAAQSQKLVKAYFLDPHAPAAGARSDAGRRHLQDFTVVHVHGSLE